MLLVDHHAVGFFQDVFENGVFVLGLLFSQLDIDIVVDHTAFERAGTIQRVRGDNVEEMIGLHSLEQVTNASAFQLENALRFATAQYGERLFVIQGERVRIDAPASRLFDQVDGLGEDREVAESKEIHLQEARRLDVVHRPLCDDIGLS